MTILFPYMARWNSANMSRYYHLFTKIAEAGHTVVVLQPPPRKSEETNYIDFPMENHGNIVLDTVKINARLWNMKFPIDKFFKKALYTIWSLMAIKRLTNQFKPDAIVVYNLPQYIYTIGSTVPVIFDYADDYIAMFRHELGISERHVLTRIASALLHRLIRRSLMVTSVSEILNKKTAHPNAILLPNGADIRPHAVPPPMLHIEKTKLTCGYVGAFEYFIDLDLMIQIAKILPECSFVFVGAGREFVRVKEQVAELNLKNVVLTGAVPHRQAMQFIAEMDVCLNLFVKSEVSHAASPIKLFEYLASGKPVLTTRLIEVQRLDPHGDIVYYADDAAEAVATIRQLMRNDSNKAERMKRGKALVEQHYTWEIIAQKFVEAASRSLKRKV